MTDVDRLDVLAHCGRVLAAWDQRAEDYDADRGGTRGYYQRRAEGVLRTANYQGAVEERDRLAALLAHIERHHPRLVREARTAVSVTARRGQ